MHRYADSWQPRESTGTFVPINPEAATKARAAAPPDVLLTLVVETFQALGDPTRARILYALVQGELCVRDLSIVAGVSESATSHQLRLLRGRRLVRSRRDGTTIYYALDDHHVAALIREAEYHARSCAPGAARPSVSRAVTLVLQRRSAWHEVSLIRGDAY